MSESRASKEPAGYLPQLSLAERDRRWKTVREKMVTRGLDCLLVWSNDLFFGLGLTNFRYLTHCAAFGMGGYALFPLDGDPLIFLGTPDMNQPHHACMGTQNWVKDIRPVPKMDKLVEILKEMGYGKSRTGLVGYGSALVSESYGYRSYAQLLQGLPEAQISDQTSLIEELRLIKSPEEIRMLDKSGELAKKCVEALIATARPGVRECEVWAAMMSAQVANGGEPHVFNWISSGNVTEDSPMQQRLLHGNPPPAAPTTRALQKGDLVICEYHASYGGYLSAVEFTLFVGDAPRPLVDLHGVAVECLMESLTKFKPGVRLGEVVEAMRRPVAKAGYDYIELGFHGHGLASPEFPSIVHKPNTAAGLYGRMAAALENIELRPGMVFGTNIDIHNPQWKTDVGIMYGDTILVTENEPRRLVGIPTEFTSVR